MKKLSVLPLVMMSVISYSQPSVYRHAASAEFLGLGGSLSARYDYLFSHSLKGFFNASIGVGGLTFPGQTLISAPHAVTYNFGNQFRFFEIGVGATYAYRRLNNPSNENFPTAQYSAGPMAGYRSISKNGFQFRVYATAFVSDERVMPWVGIGFGKAFRKKK